jgi:hypothetical protein
MANIVYGTINAGFVALPYACYEVGIPTYIFCVISVAVIAGYTTTMVIKLASDQSTQPGAGGRGSIPRTLEDLAEVAYGFGGYCVVATLQILLSLTLACLSLDVWGELSSSILSCRLQNVASSSFPASLRWFLTNRVGGVLSGGCIVLPLVLRYVLFICSVGRGRRRTPVDDGIGSTSGFGILTLLILTLFFYFCLTLLYFYFATCSSCSAPPLAPAQFRL